MAPSDSEIRVLLVDDEEDFLAATARTLSRRGFAVQTAKTGAEGLAALEASPFDVGVFDVRMPDIDGYELTRRAWERVPGLPVVILTGHGTIDKAFELSRRGVFDYLTKPADVERLAGVLRAAAGRGPRPVPAGSRAEPEGTRVLLVDDEEEFLASLAKVLARRGFTVRTATRGEEGLQILAAERFDVAVVDVRMPGIDGLEFLGRSRKLESPPEIILLTGHATMSHAVDGLRRGAFDYLTKPCDTEELSARIRSATIRRREREEADRQARVLDILRRNPD